MIDSSPTVTTVKIRKPEIEKNPAQQRLKKTLRAHAILILFEKPSCENYFQIELEVVCLLVQIAPH